MFELLLNFQQFLNRPFLGDDSGLWYVLMAFSVALPCSLRRMTLIGDAISHSVLPGIVLAFLVVKDLSSPWLVIGAAISGLLVTIMIEMIHSKTRVKQDAAIGISFTTLFAIGVLLISLFVSKQTDLHVDCIIGGEMTHIIFYDTFYVLGKEVPAPLLTSYLVATLTVSAIIIFYRVLMLSSFDPGLTASLGINPKVIHYLLMAFLSLVVVSSFRAVGAILVIALLVIPAASAYLCTHRLKIMLLLAGLHAALSSVIAIYIYTNIECSISSAMVVAGVILFTLAWLFGPVDGLIWKWKRKYFQLEIYQLGDVD
jgi:manganese/zinc/iron transport system permease protein